MTAHHRTEADPMPVSTQPSTKPVPNDDAPARSRAAETGGASPAAETGGASPAAETGGARPAAEAGGGRFRGAIPRAHPGRRGPGPAPAAARRRRAARQLLPAPRRVRAEPLA